MRPEFKALFMPTSEWLQYIQEEVTKDLDIHDILNKISTGEVDNHWQYHNGVLFYKSHIFLSKKSELIPIILQEIHRATHEGYFKTLTYQGSVLLA